MPAATTMAQAIGQAPMASILISNSIQLFAFVPTKFVWEKDPSHFLPISFTTASKFDRTFR